MPIARLKNGGYWRKRIDGKSYYFRYPHTAEGYANSMVAYWDLLATMGRTDKKLEQQLSEWIV